MQVAGCMCAYLFLKIFDWTILTDKRTWTYLKLLHTILFHDLSKNLLISVVKKLKCRIFDIDKLTFSDLNIQMPRLLD